MAPTYDAQHSLLAADVHCNVHLPRLPVAPVPVVQPTTGTSVIAYHARVSGRVCLCVVFAAAKPSGQGVRAHHDSSGCASPMCSASSGVRSVWRPANRSRRFQRGPVRFSALAAVRWPHWQRSRRALPATHGRPDLMRSTARARALDPGRVASGKPWRAPPVTSR